MIITHSILFSIIPILPQYTIVVSILFSSVLLIWEAIKTSHLVLFGTNLEQLDPLDQTKHH